MPVRTSVQPDVGGGDFCHVEIRLGDSQGYVGHVASIVPATHAHLGAGVAPVAALVQPVPGGDGGQLNSRVDLQLSHQRGDVRLDCIGGDVQVFGDRFIGLPCGHQLQHLPFPRA
jgi:hypothetical protein